MAWPAIVGAVIGGAASIAGGKYAADSAAVSQQNTNYANLQIAREANAASALEAQKNRDWQEMMSNTSYQRSMADLEAAGINPMLAYTSGASTPGGATATAQAARMESTERDAAKIRADSVVNAIDRVLAVMTAKANIKKVEAEAQTAKDLGYKLHHEGNLAAMKNYTENAVLKKLGVDTKMGQLQLDTAKKYFEYNMDKLKIDKDFLKIDSVLDRVLPWSKRKESKAK